jgi:hypothetical protein
VAAGRVRVALAHRRLLNKRKPYQDAKKTSNFHFFVTSVTFCNCFSPANFAARRRLPLTPIPIFKEQAPKRFNIVTIPLLIGNTNNIFDGQFFAVFGGMRTDASFNFLFPIPTLVARKNIRDIRDIRG